MNSTKKKHKTVFMDISVDGKDIGRIFICLYDDVSPVATENFRALCTGERGIGLCGMPLHFKGCKILSVVRTFKIETGDFSNGEGTGNESVFNGLYRCEEFIVDHKRKGIVSMVNCGENTFGSKFLITLDALPMLNGKNLVIGEVIPPFNVLNTIVNEADTIGDNDKPKKEIIISNCGEFRIHQ